MARDPLAVLQRLRDMEVNEARRVLGERRAQEEAAQREAEAAQAALVQEALLGDPQAYAAWLPRGRAELERRAKRAQIAAQRREQAEEALVQARAGLRSVERLAELRAEEAEAEEARRRQIMLDEVGARPFKPL